MRLRREAEERLRQKFGGAGAAVRKPLVSHNPLHLNIGIPISHYALVM